MLFIEFTFFYGVLTGLIPSLHPNNLVYFVDRGSLIEIALVHSFINIIPNIYFLVPDVYTITSLNASHQLFKKQEALFVLFVSGLGSLLGGLFSLIFFFYPQIFYYLNETYFLVPLIFLTILLAGLIQKTWKERLISLILLFLAFLLIKLNESLTKDLFFPLLGFFGLSSVLVYSKTKIKQRNDLLTMIKEKFNSSFAKNIIIFSFLGVVLSLPANTYPLVTPTHFLIFLSLFLKFGLYESIVLVSSLSTSDFVLSVVTKEYFNYSRNFVIQHANLISIEKLIFLLFLSFLLLLTVGFLINYLNNNLPRKVVMFLVLLSIFWPFFLDLNFNKLLILILSAVLGFVSLKLNIERINLFNGYLLWYLFK